MREEEFQNMENGTLSNLANGKRSNQADLLNSNNSTSVDFSKLTQINSNAIVSNGRRGGSDVLSLNLVWSEANGKRAKLSQALYEKLGRPESIQAVQDGSNLIIGKQLPGATVNFDFSKGKGINIIYSVPFVKWVIDTFELDYTGGVSKSFSNIRIKTQEANGSKFTFAIIDMKNR
jgi:hypothetical protein